MYRREPYKIYEVIKFQYRKFLGNLPFSLKNGMYSLITTLNKHFVGVLLNPITTFTLANHNVTNSLTIGKCE